MIRVFFITQWYPSDQNPIFGTFVREHARAIALNNRVFVLHIRGVNPSLKSPYHTIRMENGNLTEIQLEYSRSPIPRTTWMRRFSSVNSVFRELCTNGDNPDLIHANVFNTADLAVYLSYRYKIPAVLTEHSSAIPRRLLKRYQIEKIRFLLNRLALILPVSKDLGTRLNLIGVNTPMVQIPNAVDTSLFSPSEHKRQTDCCRLITIASLDENKNISDLISALAILKKDLNFSSKLEIIGDGPLRSELEKQITLEGLSNAITLQGVLPKQIVAERLRSADIFLLPSQWENQPAAIIEAFACGLPVIASRVGGIPEIVPEKFGRLLPPNDPVSIATAIVDLCNQYNSIDRHAISDYAKSQFGYATISNQFSHAYQQVLDANKNK